MVMVNHPIFRKQHPMDKPSMFIGENPWRNPWRSPWEGEKIRLDRTAPCCCSAPCRPGRTGNAAQNLNGKKLASIAEKNKCDDQSSSIIINHQSSIIIIINVGFPQAQTSSGRWRNCRNAWISKFKAYCGVVCSISILVGYANITQRGDISTNFMLKLSKSKEKKHISAQGYSASHKKNTVVGVTSQLMQVPIKDQPTTNKPDPKSWKNWVVPPKNELDVNSANIWIVGEY